MTNYPSSNHRFFIFLLFTVSLYPILAQKPFSVLAKVYSEECIFEVFTKCDHCNLNDNFYSYSSYDEKYLCLKKCLAVLNEREGNPCDLGEETVMYDEDDLEEYEEEEESVPLRSLAERNGLYFGMALNYHRLYDTKYTRIAANQFSSITAENACKWSKLQPAKNVRKHKRCDRIVTEAIKNGQVVRGHALIWARSTTNPKWFTEGDYTKDESIVILQDHIDHVLRYYGNNVYVWDVVNEPISDVDSEVLKKRAMVSKSK